PRFKGVLHNIGAPTENLQMENLRVCCKTVTTFCRIFNSLCRPINVEMENDEEVFPGSVGLVALGLTPASAPTSSRAPRPLPDGQPDLWQLAFPIKIPAWTRPDPNP